ncbi:MAG TPA: hypothetical protein VK390_09005 [Propionibacteriaceae bacterium]|nr:hypothetical protein [Propionibacteriaceae bacterium]
MHSVRRSGVMLGVVALLLTLFAATATAQPAANQAVRSCNGVFSGKGAGGTLTKSLAGVQNNGDGTFTLTYQVTTDRPFGTYRLRDCVFQDLNGNQAFDSGEPLLGTQSKSVSVGVPTSPSIQESITVSGKAEDVVCDRVALAGSGAVSRSNVVCTTLTGTPIPVGTVGGLGLAVLAAGGFALAQRRSRRRHSPATSAT